MAGVSGTDSGSSIAFQSDGKIVAAGGTIDDFLVARYDSAGNPDPSFHDDGVYTNLGVRTTDFGGSDGAGGVAVQPDGKIVAAGTSVTYRPDGSAAGRFAIARYEAGPAPINLRPPAISGTAAAGQTLTALPGDWTDSTEPSSYQWLMCDANGTGCANIAGATTNKYVLAAADVGLRIRVRETASNANGSSSAESAATPEVSGTVVNLRPPAISGTPTEGQTLTVTPGTWSTTNNITRTLQWRRCDRSGANCLDIAGASSSSYVLLAPDVDHTIRVRETATRTATGVQSSADSAATPVVRAKPGEIAGTVRNRKTGGAIANATVNCGSGYSANTNSGGAFLITAVTAPASYRCTASATGYLSSAAQRVTVSAGETATVAFSLARQ